MTAVVAEYATEPIINLANRLPTASLLGEAVNGNLFTGVVWGAVGVLALDMLMGPTIEPDKIFGMKLPAFAHRVSSVLGVGVEVVGTALVAGAIGAAAGASGMAYNGLVPMAAGLGVAAVGKTVGAIASA